MKKITLLLTALVVFTAMVSAQKSGIITEVLRQSAEGKVVQMKELIKFDDAQAEKLKKLEFAFLLDVQKAENCCLCNKKKRIEKLQKKRDAELQQILTRDEYIKYDAVENKKIKKHPLWAE